MMISKKWTDAERLHAVNMIAAEMDKAHNDVHHLDVAEWSQRLAFLANKSAEFLEANRRAILVKYFSEAG